MSTDDFDDEYVGEPVTPRVLVAPDHLRVVGLITNMGEGEDERSVALAIEPVPAALGDTISILTNGKEAAALVEREAVKAPQKLSDAWYREKAEEIVECIVICDLNQEESTRYVTEMLKDIAENGK